jgi:nucleotide-binding universal stress UspA family protein
VRDRRGPAVPACEVHLVTVGESDAAVQSLEDVERSPQLHYSEVRSEAIPHRLQKAVAETLLDRAQALGGALLVMGAYSHWRWREQVFGGVTEAILARARSPVLMAH